MQGSVTRAAAAAAAAAAPPRTAAFASSTPQRLHSGHAVAAAATAATATAAAAATGGSLRCVFSQRRQFGALALLQRLGGSGGSSTQQPSLRGPQGAPGPPPALTGVFDSLMAVEKKGREAVSSLLDREGRMQKKQQLLLLQFYAFYVKQLMAKQGTFALEDFLVLKTRLLEYLERCEEEIGGLKRRAGKRLREMGLKAFKPQDSEEVQKFKQEIRVLQSLTPSELRLTCPSGLSLLAKRTVAAAAGVSLKEVEALLLQFSTMQGDRHWFMRRLELGRPLPGSLEDRHLLAEADRPYEIRLPYGDTFYNYEVEMTRKLLKLRGDGRGDRRRARNARKLATRCRLYHPKPRQWTDRWLFFPEFFADPYANFAARRLHLQQQRRKQQRQQQQEGLQQRPRWKPLPRGIGIKRKRLSLQQLHAAFARRLPAKDEELRLLLQRAAAAEEGRRLLRPKAEP
ncbi:hypothetical protein Esti_002867 [Eimeria stiedai]